jgi:hypothetical protein
MVMQNKALTIFIDHSKLIHFKALALEIVQQFQAHCRIEININPEKTRAIVNFLLMNVNESEQVFTTGRKLDELKELALDFARASNTRIKIEVSFDTDKTTAHADIMLLGVNKA